MRTGYRRLASRRAMAMLLQAERFFAHLSEDSKMNGMTQPQIQTLLAKSLLSSGISWEKAASASIRRLRNSGLPAGNT
ncbi:MAG: hypothetical protein ACK4ZS_02770 [Sulfurimicrobium sp.]